jgi:peptidoglycan/xylan/chitin deacetylase (PgdA/CDA1 family)
MLPAGSFRAAGRRADVRISSVALALLGHPAVSRGATYVSGTRLRVLGYHDVPDTEAFRRHAQYLAERYRVVSGSVVARALTGGQRLPKRSVWLTFDDGHPGVFDRAQPILAEFGLTATAYVCPGVVDTEQPYWWETVRDAAQDGTSIEIDGRAVAANELEASLKRCPDSVRRTTVDRLRERDLSRTGIPLRRPQATRDQLRSWHAAGHEVGNHTWDHPCLDRCSVDEQRHQIATAHEWLDSEGLGPVTSFAYPNGNWSAASEQLLVRLGYRTSVGFDHRLARLPSRPLRLSRLRLDADADPTRLRAVVSGTQPVTMAARDRLTGRATADPRRLPR